MSLIPLIFNCTFSDQEYITLNRIMSILKENYIICLSDKILTSHSLQINLYNVFCDLNEIIKNHNSMSHQYNSYILNLLLVKLSYIVVVVRKLNNVNYVTMIESFDQCIIDLKKILHIAFERTIDFEPFP
jgi:hypothetical protein